MVAMGKMKSRLIIEFQRLFQTGFFHIFSSQVLNKAITFSSSVFVVRLLTKADFGIYAYANNVVLMFLLLDGLGVTSGFLQFGSENGQNPQKLAAYEQYAWRIGLWVNAALSVMIAFYALAFDLMVQGVAGILLFMAVLPICNFIVNQIQVGFRVRLQNKAFSLLSVLKSILLMIGTLLGAYLFGIRGIVAFQYVGYFVVIIYGGILVVRRREPHYEKYDLAKKERRSFKKLSFVSCVNNTIAQMLYLLDVFMIGIIIPEQNTIAVYKTATIIPFAMLFVPSAIIMYVYPYFASHNQDRVWVRQRYHQLTKRLILLNASISFCMYIFAPWIIRGLFGSSYMEAVEPFRILSIGYFIAATFRIPAGNILVSLHKVTFNLYNSLISGVVNILLNIVLITKYGSIGAAYCTIIVFILSSFISTLYLNKLLKD